MNVDETPGTDAGVDARLRYGLHYDLSSMAAGIEVSFFEQIE
jgi:hypothetical protein